MKQKTNFKLKILFLLSALFIFSIALALNANAEIDCNLTSPTTLGNFSVLNATFNVSADGDTGNVSVFFEGRSTSTANSSFSFVGNVTNTSNLRHTNLTIGNDVIAEDASDWEFRATCYLNASSSTITPSENVATSSSITGRTLDRGSIPTIPTSLSPTGTNATTTLNFTSSVAGAGTTACTLRFTSSTPGDRDYAMTHTGNLCYVSIAGIAKATYNYQVIATDGTNVSTSATAAINVDGTGSSRRKAIAVGAAAGGGVSREQIGKGLAIASATRAGEVSNGLAKAQVQINQFVERETQGKELTKTGIGIGTGVVIGVLIPTLVIPGVGLITAPILGGLIGAGIGVAI